MNECIHYMYRPIECDMNLKSRVFRARKYRQYFPTCSLTCSDAGEMMKSHVTWSGIHIHPLGCSRVDQKWKVRGVYNQSMGSINNGAYTIKGPMWGGSRLPALPTNAPSPVCRWVRSHNFCTIFDRLKLP